MKSRLKWIRQWRLPKWTELREALCLLTLCAAMIFSILNIGVHRLTEKLWTPISIGLSPDGKEYYSISRAGIRVHDVESEKELQRVTWRSPWRDLALGKLQEEKPIYLFQDRENNYSWGSFPKSVETTPSIIVSPSRRYVIGRFPGGCCVWWDRVQQTTRVLSFPNHMLLRCFIDESRDVFQFEGFRIPPPVLQRACLPPPTSTKSEPLLNRTIDVIQLRLSSGDHLKTAMDVLAGAAVNNDPNMRLWADRTGLQVELRSWEYFPEGIPVVTSLVGCDELAELAACRIEKTQEGVTIFSTTYRGGVEELQLERFSAKVLSYRSDTSLYGFRVLSTPGTFAAYSSFDDVSAVVAVQDEIDPSLCRFCSVDEAELWCDASVTVGDGENCIRSANDEGQIVDCPRQNRSPTVWRRLHLNPYPNVLLVSVLVVTTCAVVWAVNAYWSKKLITEHGWLLLIVAAIWPAYCWGVALAYGNAFSGKFLIGTSAVAALLLLLCGVFLMSRGPARRPAAIAATLFVVVLMTWMLENVGDYQAMRDFS